MSGFMGDLNAQQHTALEQFKARFGESWKPNGIMDDYVALRFLRARDFNVDKAEKMFCEHLKWRKASRVDDLRDTYIGPEVLRRYLAGGIIGHDREGSPVYIWSFGNVDIEGLFNSCTPQEIEEFVSLGILEYIVKDCENQTKKLGRKIDRVVVIVDMEEFGIRKVFSRQCLELIRICFTTYEANYPEILKFGIAVRTSRLFPIFWNFVKVFLAPKTIEKIAIYAEGDSSWKDLLLDLIDAVELPQHWAGTKVGKNGCPKCSDICPTLGPVDKRYYRNLKTNISDFDSLSVPPESIRRIETDALEGSIVFWKFKVSQPIVYSVSFITQNEISDISTTIVDNVLTDQTKPLETGSHTSIESAKYVIEFDNTTNEEEVQVLYEFIAAHP